MTNVEQISGHPAFPQPDDPATVLWRYMNYNKFEWLVTSRRLLMPSADRLGDPWEGTTPKGELRWWRREAAAADSVEQSRVIDRNREFLSRMARGFRNHYYVSCWHMNQHENHALWKSYTSQPEAVAIQTTYLALRKCLPTYVEMGMVRYIDYASDRLPTFNMFEYVMHKDIYYRFETEVRAVALPPAVDRLGRTHFLENHFESESSPGFVVYAPPIDVVSLVHEVVLHPDATSEFAERVADMCVQNGLPHPGSSRRTRQPVF